MQLEDAHTGKVDVCPVSDVRNADRRDFDHEESEDPYIVSLNFTRTGRTERAYNWSLSPMQPI